MEGWTEVTAPVSGKLYRVALSSEVELGKTPMCAEPNSLRMLGGKTKELCLVREGSIVIYLKSDVQGRFHRVIFRDLVGWIDCWLADLGTDETATG